MEDMERQIENMEISERRMTINCGKGLPPLIAKTIFSKLVISDLPSCRLVSNTWNDLVLDYASSTQLQFLKNAFLLSTSDRGLNYKLCNPKMHCINLDTRQLSNDFDFDLESEFIKSASLQFDGDWTYTIIMAGSCNGLMLISKCSDYTWCQGIFNPMTNEFLQVSEHGTFDDFYLYGFGFSPITKQYKLFRVFDKGFRCRRTSSTVDTHYTMEVLTFGRSGTNHSIPIHNQWRRLHTLPFEIVADGVYLNGIIYWLVKEKDFLVLFFTDALFYCGVAVFLFLIDRSRRTAESDTLKNSYQTLSNQFGRGISSVATLALSLIIPMVTMGLVWPWTGPAASAKLAPYLVGIVVQFAFEQYARCKKSCSWPVIQIVFQVYRLHQLNITAQLVTTLSFTIKGAEMTPNNLAINSSLGTLLNVLQCLGIICIWSLSSFLMRFFPSTAATVQ